MTFYVNEVLLNTDGCWTWMADRSEWFSGFMRKRGKQGETNRRMDVQGRTDHWRTIVNGYHKTKFNAWLHDGQSAQQTIKEPSHRSVSLTSTMPESPQSTNTVRIWSRLCTAYVLLCTCYSDRQDDENHTIPAWSENSMILNMSWVLVHLLENLSVSGALSGLGDSLCS